MSVFVVVWVKWCVVLLSCRSVMMVCWLCCVSSILLSVGWVVCVCCVWLWSGWMRL